MYNSLLAIFIASFFILEYVCEASEEEALFLTDVKFLKDEVLDLKAKVLKLEQSQTERECEKEIAENPSPNTNVAFNAYMSKGFTSAEIAEKQHLIYDVTQTNVGNAYDNVTGTFRAPHTGVYGFAWLMCVDASPQLHGEIPIELIVNGRRLAVTYCDTELTHDRDCTTGFALEHVSAGEYVFLRTVNRGEGSFRSHGDMRWTFSGWKLF